MKKIAFKTMSRRNLLTETIVKYGAIGKKEWGTGISRMIRGGCFEEIKFAHFLNKPIVAVRITQYDNSELNELKVQVIPCRKDSLEVWINANL